MFADKTVAEPASLTITEAVTALSNGQLKILDLLRSCQDRIQRFNNRFRAFSHLASFSTAEIDALQAEFRRGNARSPLHGLTIGVKGSIPVASLPWTEGSAIFANRIATTDAAIVSRARQAGAIILGTTTLSELAMYGVRNAFEQMGINPWCPERTAGGSSTGAGVAACLGMASVNIGTDSGGSIRNPACHTGVVGFMASADTLPAGGVPEHVPSLPALGLIARSVADVTVAYETLSPDTSCDPRPTQRLLVPRCLIEQVCDEETASLFARALQHLRSNHFALIDCDISSWRDGEAAAGIISLFEAARSLRRMDCALASDGIRDRRDAGLRVSERAIDKARRSAAIFCREMTNALDVANADAFISPTWPFAAPLIDEQSVSIRGEKISVDPHRNCFVRAANAAGATALTLPMGLYPGAHVPAGIHLMAARARDHRLLAVAARVEHAMPRLPLPPPLRETALSAQASATHRRSSATP